MHLATVDGDVLTKALRAMAGAPRELLGTAFWTFRGEIRVEWTTYEQPIEAQIEVALAGALAVAGRHMKQAGLALSFEGPVEVTWEPDQGRLGLGPHRLPARLAEPGPRAALPLDAGDRDLLRALLASSAADLRRAGYGEDVERVEGLWREGLDQAVEALAWTGIDRRVLDALLTAALLG